MVGPVVKRFEPLPKVTTRRAVEGFDEDLVLDPLRALLERFGPARDEDDAAVLVPLVRARRVMSRTKSGGRFAALSVRAKWT
jgi:hypothetical protein